MTVINEVVRVFNCPDWGCGQTTGVCFHVEVTCRPSFTGSAAILLPGTERSGEIRDGRYETRLVVERCGRAQLSKVRASDHSRPKISHLCSASDCWVIIDGKVFDVTDFLPVRSIAL